MNISKEILDMTIEEVMADEELAIETRNHIKNILESNDKEKITKTILGHIHVFAKYSIIKEIWNNKEFVNAVMSKMNSSNYMTTEKMLDNFSNSIDISEFLNQEEIINFLLKSHAIGHLGLIRNFLNFFDESLKIKLVDKYLEIEEISLYKLDKVVPDDFVDYVLSNDKCYEIIKNKIISSCGIFMLENEYKEIKIWEYYKDIISEWSLKEKIDYFRSINSEKLKEIVYNFLNFIDEIDNVDEFKLKYLVPYLEQDFLYNKCISDDINIINKFIKYLDFEHQTKAILELSEKRINLSRYFLYLNTDAKLFVFNNTPQLISNYNIYKIYIETKEIKCLKYLKESFIKTDDIYISVLYEDDFVNLLTLEEKEIIISKLPEFININSNDCLNYNDYFVKIIKERNVEYLRNNPDSNVYLSIDSLRKYYEIDEQIELIKYVNSNWVADILYYEDKYDFLISLLEKEPELIKKMDLSKVKIGSVKEKMIHKIDVLIPYFNEDQLSFFFFDKVIAVNDYIKGIFEKQVSETPDLINSLNLLKYFEINKQKELLRKMSVEKFFTLIKTSWIKLDVIPEVLTERLDEVIDYINVPKFINLDFIDKIYDYLDNDARVKLITQVNSLETIENLFLTLQKKSPEEAKKLFNEIIVNRRDDILLNDFQMKLSSYDKEYIKYLYNNMNMEGLMYISTYYYNKEIIDKIMKMIKEDNDVLINEKIFSSFNLFIKRLSKEDQDYIFNFIDYSIENNELFNGEYKDKLKNISSLEKLVFLNLYDKKILEGDKKVLFDKLLNNNKFILNSINSIIFDDNIMLLKDSFVDKISRYPNVQKKLNKLKNIDNNILKFIGQVGRYLDKDNINPLVFDREMSMIIEYLSSNKNKLLDYDFSSVNENNIGDITNYIFYEYKNLVLPYFALYDVYKSINELYKLPINNFTQERLFKCDEEYKKCTNIDDRKNVFFNKYLSMTLYDARNFYKTYIINYHKVIGYASSDLPIKYIEIINKIINIEDSEVLDQLYESDFIYFDMTDRLTIESIMQEAYFKSLSNDYVDKQNGTDIVKEFKDNDGNLVSIEMTELIDNFGIILHSTDAYGSMELIDNDYFVSWNNNPNTENHGICCSYITNSSYGTAPVYANGVMFGFTKINDTSITAYSPYDLATSNSGFNITCRYVPHFTLLDDIPDYTRHTHNEFNLERRNNSIDPRYPLVQPDSIIIFEDMDESIKANSIKAYNDFKAHGIELKIYYIDRVKVANNEANKINKMISMYMNTYDLNILRDIINKYESNICGCDFLGNTTSKSLNLFDQHKLFNTDMIKDLLYKTIDYIVSIEDINVRNNSIMLFIDILESEQYKFDLLDDMNKDRAHKFELYDSDLKNRVQELYSYVNNIDIEKYKKV